MNTQVIEVTTQDNVIIPINSFLLMHFGTVFEELQKEFDKDIKITVPFRAAVIYELLFLINSRITQVPHVINKELYFELLEFKTYARMTLCIIPSIARVMTFSEMAQQIDKLPRREIVQDTYIVKNLLRCGVEVSIKVINMLLDEGIKIQKDHVMSEECYYGLYLLYVYATKNKPLSEIKECLEDIKKAKIIATDLKKHHYDTIITVYGGQIIYDIIKNNERCKDRIVQSLLGL